MTDRSATRINSLLMRIIFAAVGGIIGVMIIWNEVLSEEQMLVWQMLVEEAVLSGFRGVGMILQSQAFLWFVVGFGVGAAVGVFLHYVVVAVVLGVEKLEDNDAA